MTRTRAPCVLLALVLTGCGAASGPPADPGEVGAVAARFYEGIGDADYAGRETLTTPGVEIVDGGRRMDSPGFRAFLTDGFAQGIEIDFALDRFRQVDGAWLLDRFHSTPARE